MIPLLVLKILSYDHLRLNYALVEPFLQSLQRESGVCNVSTHKCTLHMRIEM